MFLVPVSRQTQDLARSLERLIAGASTRPDTGARTPGLDLAETDLAYTVTLDLPGVAKEDVHVSVEGRRVSIQAQAQAGPEQKDGERVLHRERAPARYARHFTLPQEVDQTAADARLEQGVLKLSLPKRAARTASKITIN